MLVLLKSKPEITWYIYLYPMCTTVDHVSDVKFTLYILIYKIWIYGFILILQKPHNVHVFLHVYILESMACLIHTPHHA